MATIEERRAKARVAAAKWRAKNPAKHLEAVKRYRQANRDKVRQWDRDWRERNPAKTKEAARKSRKKWDAIPGNTKKATAHKRVLRAIKNGTLVNPRQCTQCGKRGRIEAHHHNGYEKAHQLDVVWLCCECHQKQHA